MVEAEKIGFWRRRYAISVDGREVTRFDGSTWRSGGTFELQGRRYRVSSGKWGSRYELSEMGPAGSENPRGPLATAEQVGRRNWRVQADGHTYRFRRTAWWRPDQELLGDDGPIGVIRRKSAWKGGAQAELPGLPLDLQVFVVAIMVSMWEAQAAAGAAAGPGG
jgi:hypothetical protein